MSRETNTVLIIGPNYYNFISACRASFEELGWAAKCLPYDTPIHPYTSLMKVKYKLSRRKGQMREHSRQMFNEEAVRGFDEIRPDVVFIMNGDILYPETLDHFRKSAKVALWMFDNREKIPDAIGHINHVDAMFCFDQRDVDWFTAQGKTAHFLPQACDTSIYRRLDLKKDIDILFIGHLYYSPKRKRIMNAVIERFPDRKIVVYGRYQPWFKGIIKWLRRPYKSVYKNVGIASDKVNELYNRARVVLNIHQEMQTDGANPRLFEICGSGAYQICDSNPYVKSLFPDGEVGLYENEEQLFNLIEYALNNDMTQNASAAYEKVVGQHSFIQRLDTVLGTF